MDDTRTFVQPGINLFGLLSLEYAMTLPMSDAPALPDRERVLIRLDLNGALLDRMFRRVPFRSRSGVFAQNSNCTKSPLPTTYRLRRP